MKKIEVTSPSLPNQEKLFTLLESVHKRCWLTNEGPLNQELARRLTERFDVKYLLLVSSGTLALQIAYKIKKVKDNSVLTSPFTFAATSTAIAWEGGNPIFTKINKHNWNMCPNDTEDYLKKSRYSAIAPVNIFGSPCDVEAFDYLGEKYNVPVIYDSAHSPLSSVNGKSLFNYGDIHCISLHATKLLHSIEGGAIIFKNECDYLLAKSLINFGQTANGEIFTPGINGKLSEYHAAAGLCILDDLDEILTRRAELVGLYKRSLRGVEFQKHLPGSEVNPMYMPVKFDTYETLLQVSKKLNEEYVYPRHYFQPEKLKFVKAGMIPSMVNEISKRVLCLPLSANLKMNDVEKIVTIVNSVNVES